MAFGGGVCCSIPQRCYSNESTFAFNLQSQLFILELLLDAQAAALRRWGLSVYKHKVFEKLCITERWST